MTEREVQVGLLWRAEWDPPLAEGSIRQSSRLHAMFAAFETLGVTPEPVVYSDDSIDAVQARLLGLDGVLVWVNPIEKGLDRSRLDPLLREVAAAGVWVSAHPDVILRMATKRVLVDTESMSWSTDTYLYEDGEQLSAELPGRVVERGPLVVKQHRGMGGAGVWKVESASADRLRVQQAKADAAPEVMSTVAFLELCTPYFTGEGLMVEQPFQSRLAEGMIRVYLSHDTVVGFSHQYPRAFLDTEVAANLPTEKRFELPSTERYEPLRARMESDWVSDLQRLTGVRREELPAIWDADFLYGPKDDDGRDTYVLCEINASSTFAFPEFAMPAVASAALARIAERRRSSCANAQA
jgi:hypothetical protein